MDKQRKADFEEMLNLPLNSENRYEVEREWQKFIDKHSDDSAYFFEDEISAARERGIYLEISGLNRVKMYNKREFRELEKAFGG